VVDQRDPHPISAARLLLLPLLLLLLLVLLLLHCCHTTRSSSWRPWWYQLRRHHCRQLRLSSSNNHSSHGNSHGNSRSLHRLSWRQQRLLHLIHRKWMPHKTQSCCLEQHASKLVVLRHGIVPPVLCVQHLAAALHCCRRKRLQQQQQQQVCQWLIRNAQHRILCSHQAQQQRRAQGAGLPVAAPRRRFKVLATLL
jgi:hypothetical protein